MLLTEVSRPFSDPAWGFELKYDGYRVLAEVDQGVATLRTRNGGDATKWFPEVTHSLAFLPGRHIVDGEVCVLDDLGRSDFMRLQQRASHRRSVEGADLVAYCIFDVLVFDGDDVMSKPLIFRKERLEELLADRPNQLLLVRHVDEMGEGMYEAALQLKLEGIVASGWSRPISPACARVTG